MVRERAEERAVHGQAAGPRVARTADVVLFAVKGGDTVVLELPVAPRITLPHPAVDTVRGSGSPPLLMRA